MSVENGKWQSLPPMPTEHGEQIRIPEWLQSRLRVGDTLKWERCGGDARWYINGVRQTP